MTYQFSTHRITSSQWQAVLDGRLPLHPFAKTRAILRQSPGIDHTIESTRARAHTDDNLITIAFHSYIRRDFRRLCSEKKTSRIR